VIINEVEMRNDTTADIMMQDVIDNVRISCTWRVYSRPLLHPQGICTSRHRRRCKHRGAAHNLPIKSQIGGRRPDCERFFLLVLEGTNNTNLIKFGHADPFADEELAQLEIVMSDSDVQCTLVVAYRVMIIIILQGGRAVD
jgi:hypothetical protein